MALFTYQAQDLFQWLATRADMVVVDVRNAKDFERFHGGIFTTERTDSTDFLAIERPPGMKFTGALRDPEESAGFTRTLHPASEPIFNAFTLEGAGPKRHISRLFYIRN